MQSQNEYIGDDKFVKMLEHYNCPTRIEVIKMKFIGAICSPNLELRPTDVITSFWEQGKSPRLETKDEADLFFKFFMGLWDDLFEKVKRNDVKLSKLKIKDKEDFIQICDIRYIMIEFGYVEGFWGGKDSLDIPAYVAELIDSMSELAENYKILAEKAKTISKLSDNFLSNFEYTNKMVDKAISFIIENTVLPRIEEVSRTVN